MLKAYYIKHILKFNTPGGTSRGVLRTKPGWFIKLVDENGRIGIGECSIIPGLSYDDRPGLENKIVEVCKNINEYKNNYHISLKEWPAIRFAIETALKGLESESPYLLYNSEFTKGTDSININGLIWMGSVNEMEERIEQKLEQGFSCLKLKIGAMFFNEEITLLKKIRERYSEDVLEIRVDANGAFAVSEAFSKLEALAGMHIHSIEQPVKAGQVKEMRKLCANTPLPIALDEELIGVVESKEKEALLNEVKPQYIIVKPGLLGGWRASEEWIDIADKSGIRWWATSALESNIGLNAIAQWTYTKNNDMPQGLGTGKVFSNNINSPLELKGEKLFYNPAHTWGDPFDKIR